MQQLLYNTINVYFVYAIVRLRIALQLQPQLDVFGIRHPFESGQDEHAPLEVVLPLTNSNCCHTVDNNNNNDLVHLYQVYFEI